MPPTRAAGRLVPTSPRKLPPITEMEVMSIKDFDREQIDELDHILDSAVDHLVTLTQPKPYWPTLSDLLYRFGTLRLEEENGPQRFDFSLPSSCPLWPGPNLGTHSLHKVISKPPGTSKPKKGGVDRRRNIVSVPKGRIRPTKDKTAGPQLRTSTIARTPPLQLLNLPAEIRNLVWSLLATRKDPVEAQMRPIRPCRRLTPHRQAIVRRFPQEPPVAKVNKQLRREVLSIFYGTNHFVFERNACNMFAGYGMLSPPNIMKWKPQPEFAGFLTTVDVKFNALPRTIGMVQIVYALRRTPDGATTVNVKVEKLASKKKKRNKSIGTDEYCLCNELGVAEAIAQAASKKRDQDLADYALDVVRIRHDMLFTGAIMTIYDSGRYFPQGATCVRCDKPTFEAIYCGV